MASGPGRTGSATRPRPQKYTAAMLPTFLRALKHNGYRVVHVVPARHNSLSSVQHSPENPAPNPHFAAKTLASTRY